MCATPSFVVPANARTDNQPRILIGNDARFMDLQQRFPPATYWAVLVKRIEKMAANAGK